MKTDAAILTELGKALEVVELEIPDLRAGQVLVEVGFSGVCHTQLLECAGDRGHDPYLPHCLGHEGSGIVRELGSGVDKVKTGAPVILSWIGGSGATVTGTVYGLGDRHVNAGPITTFSRHTVVSESRLTPLPDGVDLRHGAVMGCAVPTGLGSVFNTAKPKPDQGVVVFGTGGIGLCAVAGARIAGCHPVIAVDMREERLTSASEMGATHCINAGVGDPLEQIQDICPGGTDFAIEATGQPSVMEQALIAVRSRGGSAVIIGNARSGTRVTLDPKQLNQGKRLLGAWGGDCDPDRDYPKYCDLLLSGKLNLDPLLSGTYSLDEINRALSDLRTGRAARPLIDMSLLD